MKIFNLETKLINGETPFEIKDLGGKYFQVQDKKIYFYVRKVDLAEGEITIRGIDLESGTCISFDGGTSIESFNKNKSLIKIPKKSFLEELWEHDLVDYDKGTPKHVSQLKPGEIIRVVTGKVIDKAIVEKVSKESLSYITKKGITVENPFVWINSVERLCKPYRMLKLRDYFKGYELDTDKLLFVKSEVKNKGSIVDRVKLKKSNSVKK